MKETAFEKICGNLSGVDINTITADDIRAQAKVWDDHGEPCTEDDIRLAIDHLEDMKSDDSFDTVECQHCGENFERIDHGDVQCPHCDGICGN